MATEMATTKRSRTASPPLPAESGINLLPEALLLEIAGRLDVESLCSAAPSCRSLRRASSIALASIARLDLSGFSPKMEILNSILRGNAVLRSLTLDCSLLDDSSIEIFAKGHLLELSLLKCAAFSSMIFVTIGERCRDLRVIFIDITLPTAKGQLSLCKKAVLQMFKSCLHLESVSLKFQLQHPGSFNFEYLWPIFPGTLKSLLLQPIANWQAKQLVPVNIVSARPWSVSLQSISLVLDKITDELLASIVSGVLHLVELCLEDNPNDEPDLPNDLTSSGLQTLGLCHNLTRLSLQRGKQQSSGNFKRVNDFGIFLLAEGCKQLEVIRLGGFSRVTDAGYASILHSCKNLKKFEIVNASYLTDLTFLNLADSCKSLREIRLLSCNLITSETPISLGACMNMEILDFSGCRSIADDGLIVISQLPKLRLLDLSGSDITDAGLSALGGTHAPISSLCLRGCKRITDRGVQLLLRGTGSVSTTLLELDLAYLPRLSDFSVTIIFKDCVAMTCLCLRNCFAITDKPFRSVASSDCYSSRNSIRMLDLCHCLGLSAEFLQWLTHPFFGRLRWLGIGKTRLVGRRNCSIRVDEFLMEKTGLKVCTYGCEMDCKNEWQHHSALEWGHYIS